MSLARTLLISSAGTLLGCEVTVDGTWPDWTWNWDPVVYDGDAGCEWDPAREQYVWYFEAEVDDWDGLDDIVYVDANVYDDWRGGYLADSFALRPTSDPGVWYGEWPERVTSLDCTYPGYSVDLVAWDGFDGSGALTIIPWTL